MKCNQRRPSRRNEKQKSQILERRFQLKRKSWSTCDDSVNRIVCDYFDVKDSSVQEWPTTVSFKRERFCLTRSQWIHTVYYTGFLIAINYSNHSIVRDRPPDLDKHDDPSITWIILITFQLIELFRSLWYWNSIFKFDFKFEKKVKLKTRNANASSGKSSGKSFILLSKRLGRSIWMAKNWCQNFCKTTATHKRKEKDFLRNEQIKMRLLHRCKRLRGNSRSGKVPSRFAWSLLVNLTHVGQTSNSEKPIDVYPTTKFPAKVLLWHRSSVTEHQTNTNMSYYLHWTNFLIILVQ